MEVKGENEYLCTSILRKSPLLGWREIFAQLTAEVK